MKFRSRRPTSKLRAAVGVWAFVAMSFLSLRLLIREYKLGSVVRIEVRNNSEFGGGAGVAAAIGKHQLLTAFHVVAGATEIYVVTPEGEYIPAYLDAVDPFYDAARLSTPWWAALEPLEVSTQTAVQGHAVTIETIDQNRRLSVRAPVVDVANIPGEGQCLILRAGLGPGASGSAILDASNRLLGLLVQGSGSRVIALLLRNCEFGDPDAPSSAANVLDTKRRFSTSLLHEDNERALALAEELRRARPGCASFWWSRASLLRKLDLPRDSFDAACEGLNRFDTNRWSCERFGSILAALDRREEAEVALTRFPESLERDPIIARTLAELLDASGRHADAIGVLDRWLVAQNLDWGVCISLIRSLHNAGRHSEARLVALGLLPHNVDSPFLLRLVASSSRQAGHTEDADLYEEIAAWYERPREEDTGGDTESDE